MKTNNPIEKLPLVSENDSEKVWFTSEQVTALQASRSPFLANNWGFVAFFILAIPKLFFSAGPIAFIALSINYMVMFSILTVVALALLSIKQIEAGRCKKAIQLCNFGLLLAKTTGTFFLAEFLLTDIQAISFSKQGRLVAAQILCARYPLKVHQSSADPVMANILTRGLRFTPAAAMYKRVYDLAKTVGDKSLLAIAATNLGFAYLLLDEAELSKQYSEEALALCPAKKVEMKTNVLINLARANLRLGSLVEAEEQLAIVLQLTDSRHKYMGQVVGELQLGYAELRLLQDRLEEALLYATSSTEFYQSTGNGEALRQYALIINARILNRLGREQESIEVTKKFNEDQLLLHDENTLLFERASELIVTGKSAELHRIALDDF